MGVTVVVKVREKGGAVPGPWVHIRKALPKGSVHNRHPIVPENPSHMVRTAHPCTNSRLRMAAGRVRRAHHATTAKHLQPISLPAAYILGGVPRPYRGGPENHSLKTIETTNIMVTG